MKALLALLLSASAVTAAQHYHRGQAVRVIDGDTLVVDVELRPGLVETDTIRLNCGNAAELRADGGAAAKFALVRRLGDGGVTVLTDWRRDSFGRLLADVVSEGRDASVCAELLDAGYILPRVYR